MLLCIPPALFAQFDPYAAIANHSFRENFKTYKSQPDKLEALGRAYYSEKEYEHTKRIGRRLIRIKQTFGDEGYLLVGNALSELDKDKRSVKVFEKGLKKFPSNQLLWYNKAIVHFDQKNYEEAAKSAMQSVALNINHPASHLMLGYATSEMKFQSHSMLAMYYYLLIANDGPEVGKTLAFIENKYKESVVKTDTGYAIQPEYAYGNPISDLFLKVYKESLEARPDSMGTLEFRAFFLTNFFSSFAYVQFDSGGFWTDTYVNFFLELTLQGHAEAFSYHTLAKTGNREVKEWMDEHQMQYDEMLWFITGNQDASP